MNEMTRLERFRSEVPRPGPATLREQEDRLLSAITAAEPSPRRPRRPLRRLAVCAVATAVLATGLTVLLDTTDPATSYANEAIDIVLRGDEYVATIKDPFADHAEYSEAFQALGLRIGLQLLPASPTQVGEIVRYGFSGTTSSDRLGGGLRPPGCTPGQAGCALTVTVTKGFQGKGVVSLGRQAKPGERYQAHARAEARGEMLHGYDPVERTVGEVTAEAGRRGLRVTFQIIEPAPDGNGFSVDPREQSVPVGDHWIVWAAEPDQADTVRLLVSAKRVPKNPVHGDSDPVDSGDAPD